MCARAINIGHAATNRERKKQKKEREKKRVRGTEKKKGKRERKRNKGREKKKGEKKTNKMFAVFLLCVLRDNLCLTPAVGCAHMDDHRACRVTSVHTLSMTTKEDCKQQVQCCGNVDGQAKTLLLTKVATTTSTWRLGALPNARSRCQGSVWSTL